MKRLVPFSFTIVLCAVSLSLSPNAPESSVVPLKGFPQIEGPEVGVRPLTTGGRTSKKPAVLKKDSEHASRSSAFHRISYRGDEGVRAKRLKNRDFINLVEQKEKRLVSVKQRS